MNSPVSQRQESDRHAPKKRFLSLFARPEIGPIGVMILLMGTLISRLSLLIPAKLTISINSWR